MAEVAHARIAAGGVRRPAEVAYFNTANLSSVTHRVARRGRGGARPAGAAVDDRRPRTGSTDVERLRELFARLVGRRRRRRRPGAGDQLRVRGRDAQPRARRAASGSSSSPTSTRRASTAGASWPRRTGAEIVTVERRGDESWTEAILAELDEPAAIVSVPNVHWTDGALIELEAVAERAHELGARLVIDASQSAGALELDVEPRCDPTSWSPSATSGCSARSRSATCGSRPSSATARRSSRTGSCARTPATSRAWSTTATPTSRARGASTWASGRTSSSCRWRSRRSSSCSSGRSRGSGRRSPRPRARSPPGPPNSASSRSPADGRGPAPARDPASRGAARPRVVPALREAGCFAALRGDSLRLSPHLHNTPAEVERLLGALGAVAGAEPLVERGPARAGGRGGLERRPERLGGAGRSPNRATRARRPGCP